MLTKSPPEGLSLYGREHGGRLVVSGLETVARASPNVMPTEWQHDVPVPLVSTQNCGKCYREVHQVGHFQAIKLRDPAQSPADKHWDGRVGNNLLRLAAD